MYNFKLVACKGHKCHLCRFLGVIVCCHFTLVQNVKSLNLDMRGIYLLGTTSSLLFNQKIGYYMMCTKMHLSAFFPEKIIIS